MYHVYLSGDVLTVTDESADCLSDELSAAALTFEVYPVSVAVIIVIANSIDISFFITVPPILILE